MTINTTSMPSSMTILKEVAIATPSQVEGALEQACFSFTVSFAYVAASSLQCDEAPVPAFRNQRRPNSNSSAPTTS